MQHIFCFFAVFIFLTASLLSAQDLSARPMADTTISNHMQRSIIASVPDQPAGGSASSHGADPVSLTGFRMQMAGGYNGELPFWIHSNRHGELDPHSGNTALHLFGAWRRHYDSGFTLSTGANLMLRGAEDASIRFQEAYVQLGYGDFVLWAGRKHEYFGTVHPRLSMGTADLSHNARPMPKITLATEGFRPFPGTRGIVDYNASFSHGWMRDNEHRYVENPMLHQKHLYIRLFNDRSRVVPQAGIKHFAQWGGSSPRDGDVPGGLRAFRDVVFSRSADSKEILSGGQLENRYQNHFGTYDFSLLFRFDDVHVSVSRQFILEDTPNARFGTPWDGMWGVWLAFPSDDRFPGRTASDRPVFTIRAINYEHINTIEGVDRYPHRNRSSYFNYYNHSRYRGGWTYEGRSLGNPLFFGDSGHVGVVNNLMLAHHAGIMGQAGRVDWRAFATYSRNYGAAGITNLDGLQYTGVTDRQDQWSFMLEVSGELPAMMDLLPGDWPLSDRWDALELTATMALDLGEAHRKNAGMMVGLRWMQW